MKRINKWLSYLYDCLRDDLPLILFVIILQSTIAALFPESGLSFHFGKVLFIFALFKSFWLGVISSLLSFRKNFIKWTFVVLNVITLDIYLYLIIQFKVRLTPNIMSLILQTNKNEAIEFFQSFFPCSTILVLISIGAASFLIYYLLCRLWKKVKPHMISRQTKSLAAASIILISILSLYFSLQTTNLYNGNGLKQIFYQTSLPYNDIYLSIKAISGNEEKVQEIKSANDNAVIDSCKHTTPHIVLVIGESFIKSHSNLYGYHHNTNPNLIKEKNAGNLFVFSDAVSHSISTGVCMQYIYSTKSINDNQVWEKSPLFPALFKKAGYKVSLFDNQSTRWTGSAAFDYSTSFFINPSEIHNQCFDFRNNEIFEFDGDFIEAYSKDIKEMSSSNSMTIIHLMGQHVKFKSRYPKDKHYTYFSPDSINRKDLETDKLWDIAHYDNATRYNDEVIKRIIDLFRNKETVLIYFSDHGECVYDNEDLTMGRTISSSKKDDIIKILYEIPMIIWCSDSFIAKHQDIVDNIKKAVDQPFMHDDISHVLLDLAGISSTVFNPTRSIINPQYVGRKRLINENSIDYNSKKQIMDSIILKTSMN